MKGLQILMLDGPLDVSTVKVLAPDVQVMEPDALACGAGFVRDELLAGGVYLDNEMWMLIGSVEVLARFRADPGIDRALALSRGAGVAAEWVGEDRKALDEGESFVFSPDVERHIWRMGGWPSLQGRGVSVAVIGTGLDSRHERYARTVPDYDFQSLWKPELTEAIDYARHGTLCAGIIAGATIGADRIAVAPSCRLIVCQHSRWRDEAFIASVEFVLLASWAIRERGARIISFSFGAGRDGFERYADPRVLSRFARRLRKKNRALIFCSAGNSHVDRGEAMTLPARCAGMVAVGGYRLRVADDCGNYMPDCRIVADAELSGFTRWPAINRDFLLGPSTGLRSTDNVNSGDVGKMGYLGASSAACAFVSGIAALYMERYPRFTVEQVLLKMQSEAEPVADARGRGWEWRGACFPR